MRAERIEPGWFEELYQRDADPWKFATSDYEQRKYQRTLAALGPPNRRFHRAFEAGCSIGVFTAMLAGRCDELLAVDASRTAVVRARDRVAHLPGVSVEERTLPEQLPAGPFDLIVCSEILYYWNADLLRELLGAIETRLAAGGSLLAVHWRPATRTYPLRGDDVHRILAERRNLVHAFSDATTKYLIDRYDQPR